MRPSLSLLTVWLASITSIEAGCSLLPTNTNLTAKASWYGQRPSNTLPLCTDLDQIAGTCPHHGNKRPLRPARPSRPKKVYKVTKKSAKSKYKSHKHKEPPKAANGTVYENVVVYKEEVVKFEPVPEEPTSEPRPKNRVEVVDKPLPKVEEPAEPPKPAKSTKPKPKKKPPVEVVEVVIDEDDFNRGIHVHEDSDKGKPRKGKHREIVEEHYRNNVSVIVEHRPDYVEDTQVIVETSPEPHQETVIIDVDEDGNVIDRHTENGQPHPDEQHNQQHGADHDTYVEINTSSTGSGIHVTPGNDRDTILVNTNDPTDGVTVDAGDREVYIDFDGIDGGYYQTNNPGAPLPEIPVQSPVQYPDHHHHPHHHLQQPSQQPVPPAQEPQLPQPPSQPQPQPPRRPHTVHRPPHHGGHPPHVRPRPGFPGHHGHRPPHHKGRPKKRPRPPPKPRPVQADVETDEDGNVHVEIEGDANDNIVVVEVDDEYDVPEGETIYMPDDIREIIDLDQLPREHGEQVDRPPRVLEVPIDIEERPPPSPPPPPPGPAGQSGPQQEPEQEHRDLQPGETVIIEEIIDDPNNRNIDPDPSFQPQVEVEEEVEVVFEYIDRPEPNRMQTPVLLPVSNSSSTNATVTSTTAVSGESRENDPECEGEDFVFDYSVNPGQLKKENDTDTEEPIHDFPVMEEESRPVSRKHRVYSKRRAAMPRLVLYAQTHHVDEKAVSLMPLIEEDTGVTHVIVAAIHINGPGNITLNDHPPDHPRFEQMWNETEQLKKQGVTIMGMLGGAAQGSYMRLSHDEKSFEKNYTPLRDIIRKYNLQGLDLDVEEPTSLETIRRLILRLKSDFGNDFIISLAPVYPAMLPAHRRFMGISARKLASSIPPPDPIMAALCKARGIHSKKNLSGFNYIDLEAQLGDMIAWYNVQLYCGWGNPTRAGVYEALIESGWDSTKVVLGVITNPRNGGGHKDIGELTTAIKILADKYQERFGGVMGWEYFNAGMTVSEREGPWEWVQSIGRVMGRVAPLSGEESEEEGDDEPVVNKAGPAMVGPDRKEEEKKEQAQPPEEKKPSEDKPPEQAPAPKEDDAPK